jgi:hypothetical protein
MPFRKRRIKAKRQTVLTVPQRFSVFSNRRSPRTLDFLHARLGELEGHIQTRLNGRVRDLRLSIRDNGLVLEGHTGIGDAFPIVPVASSQNLLCKLPSTNELGI